MSITPPESREEWITRQALERPEPERTPFLETACAGDTSLLQRVAALLKAKEAAAAAPQATVIDPSALRQRIEAAMQAEQTHLASAETPAIPPQPPGNLQPVASEERPHTVIGRYRLMEKIAEGGFGTVYVAEQKEPVKRRVALKIIKLGMDTRQVVARFEAERQALAMMDHPNIAKVFDAGATDSGRPYFVMELVRGIKITKYCDDNSLSTEKRIELFIQTCQAIQHAHQKGVIHRDIKPSNVLVALHDAHSKAVPKVIDFGIAKATQGALTDKTIYTEFQQFIGTPDYVSPEQAEMSGLDVDTRSDIYSLGVLLYELLVGKTPFDSKELLKAGLDALRQAIRQKEPVRPSLRLSNMPTDEQTTTAKLRGSDAPKLLGLLRGDLDWIVMKCLEKDRTLRYETSNELAKDLQRFLNHEPVGARPPSQLYRFRKLIRRNRLVFTSIGSVVVALLMGLLMSIWQSSRYGNIEITSEPSGASLYEKDQMMGSTPYRANNVRSGKLEYRFQLEGYQPLSLALEVGANVTTKWSVLLRKNGTVEPAVAWLSRSEAHIITLQGTVEISTDGGKRWILVGAAQSLHVGDRVRTGQNSRVQLMWSDRTVCNLGQLTEAVMLGPLTPTAVPSGGRIKVITRGATAPVEG